MASRVSPVAASMMNTMLWNYFDGVDFWWGKGGRGHSCGPR